MEQTLTRSDKVLVASARLKEDRRTAIYSEEGTSIQNMDVPLDEIPQQLWANGATTSNAELFVQTLKRTGFAELRQTITMSFSVKKL